MGKTCCISCHCTFWTYPSNFDLIISERMMFKVPGCQDQKKSKRRSMTAPFRKVVHPGFHVRQIQKSTLLPKSKITVAGSSTCHDAYSLCRLLLVMSTRVIHHLVRRYKYLAKTGTIFAWQLSDHHILFRLFPLKLLGDLILHSRMRGPSSFGGTSTFINLVEEQNKLKTNFLNFISTGSVRLLERVYA